MRPFVFALSILLFGACAVSEPAPPTVPLSRRASIDLKCPVNELNLMSKDDQLWEARGCNRIGRYVKQCGECLDVVSVAANVPITNRCDCEWVLTSGKIFELRPRAQ